MKISVLTENTTCDSRYGFEHGLCLYIETLNHKILYDLGSSDLFLQNAKKMGIDISKVDMVVISHGHNDHGGGLDSFLKVNSKAKIYIQKDAFQQHFNKNKKFIGLDSNLKFQKQFVEVTGSVFIDNEISIVANQDYDRALVSSPFYVKDDLNNCLKLDDFHHEIYLIIKSSENCVLFSGCSHQGIENIIKKFNGSVNVFFGGLHFKDIELNDIGKKYLDNVSKYMQKCNIRYYVGHCSGHDQVAYLAQKGLFTIEEISTGKVFDI